MDKIFELLGIEKLDESKQEDLKTALNTVIESKASTIAEEKVEKLLEGKEEALKEEYEKKFEEYKDDITTKFSNFVDSVLDEEMVIPENIKKYAHLGEAYEELIEQFKVRLAIDEGMIDEETKGMLKEAKEEIEKLREKIDEVRGKNLDLESDAAKMAASIYINEKCDGLTTAQSAQVKKLLDGVIVKEEIDRKFNIIVESLNITLDEAGSKTKKNEEEEMKEEGDTVNAECPKCGNKETVKEGDDLTCPECGAKMKIVEEQKESKEDNKDGKGNAEVSEEKVDEKKDSEQEKSPTGTIHDVWLRMIREQK